MGLVAEQHVFLEHVGRLLAHARDLGFVVTGGELFRTPEQQRIHMREGRSKTMASQHLKRLAIDLNFFTTVPDGEITLCYDKEVLQPLGEFWEGLDTANRWGGNWQSFKDTPHFERREGTLAAAVTVPATAAPLNGPTTVPNGPTTVPPSGLTVTINGRGRGLLSEAVGEKRPNLRGDVEAVQRLLQEAARHARVNLTKALAFDGRFGPITSEAIMAFQRQALGKNDPDGVVDKNGETIRALCQEMPAEYSPLLLSLTMTGASDEQVEQFAEPIRVCFDKFKIDTKLRQAHFLAQIGHESGELRFTEEIASGEAYNGRKDLGNVVPGDGPRFKGRGLIQLTGRANYEAFSEAMGRKDEIMDNPKIVATDLDLCVSAAGWFWENRGLNAIADKDDLRSVTKRINGGFNGIAQRHALLDRAKALYGLN